MDCRSDADPWFEVVVAKQTLWDPGCVEFGPAMVPKAQRRPTAAHRDFLRRHAIEHRVSLKVAGGVDAGRVRTQLCLHRLDHRRDFGSAERDVLRVRWSALRRAVDVHSLLGCGGRMTIEQAAEALRDAVPLPARVVGDRAFVQFENRTAAYGLAAACGTSTDHGPPARDRDAGRCRFRARDCVRRGRLGERTGSRQVTLATAETPLQPVFVKTGPRRQSELMRPGCAITRRGRPCLPRRRATP